MAFVPHQDMVMDHMMYMLTDAKTVYTVLKLYFKKKERFIMSMETNESFNLGD